MVYRQMKDRILSNFISVSRDVPLYDVKRKKKFLINASTMCNVYDTTFTFPAQGKYTITCAITNRNANTVNLPGRTDEISFLSKQPLL